MHFEQMELPEELYGHPQEVYQQLTSRLNRCREDLNLLKEKIKVMIQDKASELYAAKERLESHSRNFDIRKLAACTKESDREVFYILCGWMSEKDAIAFENEISSDENLYFFTE